MNYNRALLAAIGTSSWIQSLVASSLPMSSPRATEGTVDTTSYPELRDDCKRVATTLLSIHSIQHRRRDVDTAAYTCANCVEARPSKFCSPHHDICFACQDNEYLCVYDNDYAGIANQLAMVKDWSTEGAIREDAVPLSCELRAKHNTRIKVWSNDIKSHDTRLFFLNDKRSVKTSDIQCCLCDQYKDISLFAPPQCCGNSKYRYDIFQEALLALKSEQTDTHSICDADEQFFEVYRKSHPYCDDCIKTHGCVPLTLERDSPLYELNHPYAFYLRATAASRKSQTVDTSPLGGFLQMLRHHRHSDRSYSSETNDMLTGLEHQFGRVCRGDDDDAIVLPDFADLCCAADLGDRLSGTLVCAVRIGSSDASYEDIKNAKFMLICNIVAGENLARYSLYYRINQIRRGKSATYFRMRNLNGRVPPPNATILRTIMFRESLNEIIEQAGETYYLVDKYVASTFEQLTTILTSTRTDFVLKKRHRM
jgi:hypothetical protein